MLHTKIKITQGDNMSYKASNSKLEETRPALLPPSLRLTPSQVFGPYFLPNAPERTQIFPQGAKGSQVHIVGQVYSVDLKPIAGAVVNVWVADPSGRYDNQDDEGNPLSIPQSQMVYRGMMVADQDGSYAFDVLRPGNYFNDGPGPDALWRPAHIHVQITAPGYADLVTQLYFEDDPQDDHDLPGKSFFQPELVVQLNPVIPTAGKIQRGIFNFVLAAAAS
jgi:catechol 1,2-dioxygenase